MTGAPTLTRMELHNFDTGEYKEVLSNPTEIEEAVSPIWNRKHPIGWSSSKLHYDGTENRPITFDLYFDADKVSVSATELIGQHLYGRPRKGPEAIMDWRRFLLSFTYPVQRDDGSLDEPPDAIFVWPRFMSFRTKIDDVRFRYTRWMADGIIDIFTASLALLSVSDVMITSQDARTEEPDRIEFVFG